MAALLRSFFVRLRALIHRTAVDRELEEELRDHLERETAWNRERGMGEREAADAARRGLGNVTAHRESAWEAFGWTWLEQLAQDLRYGVRVLLRARGFTLVAVLILGLGIGASTAIFSAVHGILLRPLPYREPDRLVALHEWNRNQAGLRGGTSAPNFAAWRELTRTLEDLAAYRPWGFDLSGTGEPERVRGARVSGSLFPMLGVPALVGRTLVAADGDAGQPKVALLSEELWRRRFGADVGVLGSPLRLNGEPYLVVGVAPRGFTLPEAEVWVPLIFASYELDQRGDRALSVVGRLKPGVDIDAARGDLQTIARTLEQQFPGANAGWTVSVSRLHEEIAGPGRTPLLLLFLATCCVLLTACANVATLLLARSTARRREMALRAALGAGRLRLTRQLLTESVLLVAAAGVLGLGIAAACARLLAHVDVEWLPPGREIRIDPIVVAFSVLISLATATFLAVIPALDASRLDPSWAIKAGSFNPRTRWTRIAWRDVPVVGQVAVTLLLLIGGGLLLRSFLRAQAVDLGFSPSNVVSMAVSLSPSRYATGEQRTALFEEWRRRVEALPGVRSAGLVSHLPLAGGALSSDFRAEGIPRYGADTPRANLVSLTPGYFETMGIPIVKGRAFSDDDRAGDNPVVIIDGTLARQLWPGGEAVGRRLSLGATLGADTAWRTIVGAVGSVRSTSPEKAPDPTIYVPHSQNPWPTMGLVARTTGNPARFTKAVMSELRALDPNQPVHSVYPLDQVVGRALASRRLQTLLMTGSAVVALLLAVIGVYGMTAYSVAQRSRELGIRAALGASPKEIVGVCLRQGLKRIGVGLMIGAAAAFIGARFLRAVLFGLGPWDPATFLGALVVLGCAGALACYLPAARTARSESLMAPRLD